MPSHRTPSRANTLGSDKEHAARIAKKAALVGDRNDVALSSTPMDILLARGIVSSDEHMAVAWLASLYRYRAGRISTGGTLGSLQPNHNYSVADHERLDLQWWILTSRLGSRHMAIMIDIGAYGSVPRWLPAMIVNHTEDHGYRAFRRALRVLVRGWSELINAPREQLTTMCNRVKSKHI